jgi:phospholipid-binding lipoprotein MlaA
MSYYQFLGRLFCLLIVLLLTGCASSGFKSSLKSNHFGKSTQLIAAAAGAAQSESDLPANEDDYAYDDDDYEDDSNIGPVVADPLEGWNRIMFSFNDVFYKYLARPLSKGYEFIIPSPVRTGVHNFFHNITFPIRFISCLLQFKGKQAGYEFSKFIINTTFGIGGILDVGKNIDPDPPFDDEDFGQTLGVWNFGEGFYIVWPFLGPSSLRDTFGLAGDFFMNPVIYLKSEETKTILGAVSTLDGMGDSLDAYDAMRKNAIEPYVAVRDAYIQFRRNKIAH